MEKALDIFLLDLTIVPSYDVPWFECETVLSGS